MSNEEKKYPLEQLPDDFDFGGWETERDKALWDLSLTPEQRLQSLEEMIEFDLACRTAIRVIR
ncbi:MAG: hypothetical protein AAB229_10915 [Candidatus Hydrogenedentota bacterium]